MHVAVFQHADHEAPGALAPLLAARGHALTVYRTDRNAPPAAAAFDAFVVLGGPQGVYEQDRYPWLRDELAALRAALDAGKPVLGICLGSQLVAAALGARVYPHVEKEIGWFEVRRAAEATRSPFAADLPARLMTFHWHGDTYDLPLGATRLFESEACREQGFSVGANVLALQFHPEITPPMVSEWATLGVAECLPAPHVQDAATMQAGTAHCAAGHALLQTLVARLFP